MFSFVNGGIKIIYSQRHIDLPSLVKLIKNNPEKLKINKIRNLRRKGKDYKSLKESLCYITPNCLVKFRNLKDYDYNLIGTSSYIYFDFDDFPKSKQLKERFIHEYGHLASLICLSCSIGGISVLFKVSNNLKDENDFNIARQYIIDNILINENYDTNAGGIARAMFISYDPELYVNYENEIEVPEYYFETTVINKKKCTNGVHNNICNMIRSNCAVLDPFNPTPIKQVLDQLIFETPVNVSNAIVDYKEVDYVEIRYGYIIKDGLKRKTFTSIIHKLVYLNPNADRQILLSYLYHINQSNTGKVNMNDKELFRLFDFVFNGIKNEGITNIKPKLKRIHYNKDLSPEINKRHISGLIVGAIKQNEKKRKIESAIDEMTNNGIKISISGITRHTGIHRATVKKHLGTDQLNISNLVNELNDSLI